MIYDHYHSRKATLHLLKVMSFPSSFRDVVPSPLKPIAKKIYYKLFRLQLRVRFWCADRISIPPSGTPVPSANLRFRVSESISVSEFLRIGAGCANLIRQHVNDMGVEFASMHRVLDFGCGCGRTTRWFLRDGGTPEFHGVDVDEEAVDWCKEHLRQGHFLATAPVPPLPYPDGHFDLVYCLSVFTHLNESMQDTWLAELTRILKPRGVLLLTIYGKAARTSLDEDGQKVLQINGFVHRRSRKLKGLAPDWYQTSWHSREYVVSRLSPRFSEIRYSEIPDGQQDIVVAQCASPLGNVSGPP